MDVFITWKNIWLFSRINVGVKYYRNILGRVDTLSFTKEFNCLFVKLIALKIS